MDDVLDRAQALRAQGVPFVLATVVRVARPASARAGMKAILTADGTLDGWVGGSCAHGAVVREGLRALRAGQPRLLRLLPTAVPAEDEGVVEQPMPCHSGGALEIYLEPVLPAPRLVVVGDAPLADALAHLGALAGFAVVRAGAAEAGPEGPRAALAAPQMAGAYVVVATMGQYDEDALAHVLQAAPAYVGLVASRTRAAAVRAELARRGVDDVRLRAVKAPAGLDIGARTPEEIAVSIVAELVQVRRAAATPAAAPEMVAPAVGTPATPGVRAEAEGPHAPAPHARPEAARAPDVASGALAAGALDAGAHVPAGGEAVDPVCGMTVARAAALVAEYGGHQYYFCCAHCRQAFLREPARYAAVTT
ncbi:MAG: XdhC family protein [Armatimonadota bacterium]|nr:XdhC family protein [Armatimonadota bacterium]